MWNREKAQFDWPAPAESDKTHVVRRWLAGAVVANGISQRWRFEWIPKKALLIPEPPESTR